MGDKKPQSAHDWGVKLWSMASVARSSAEFTKVAEEIHEQGVREHEQLLSMCHTAPKAVDIDTRDLGAAIRQLVEFAWLAIGDQPLPTGSARRAKWRVGGDGFQGTQVDHDKITSNTPISIMSDGGSEGWSITTYLADILKGAAADERLAIAYLMASAPEMLSALEAVLMWFGAGDWNDAKRQQWKQLAGNDEATTRVLCDLVRCAIGQTVMPERPPARD